VRQLAGVTPVLFLLAFAPLSFAQKTHLPLRATFRSQIVQNRQADAQKLSRMGNRAMMRRFGQSGLLVRVPSSSSYYYTKSIPSEYSYLRPWSKLFLDQLGRQYFSRFKKKLRVTSMVRTPWLQESIAKRNSNAAAAYGPRRSSHLTGATMDISKSTMSPAEIAWMRRMLQSYQSRGQVYAIEEFNQPTFHIMVHKRYADDVEAKAARAARRKVSG
jgi:Family of unknown function (DUF5715)